MASNGSGLREGIALRDGLRVAARAGYVLFLLAGFTVFRPVAAQPILIHEFLAANVGEQLDEDGDPSDWIELHNPGEAPFSLTGYSLTDDPESFDKWIFPDVTIEPGDYLVVFASGKDRAEAGGELHTNFRLSSGGEYLGLVTPDGGVVHQYAPEFPPQREGVSYGLDILRSTLVAADAAFSFHVPTDDALGLGWTEPEFDDSGWRGAGEDPAVRLPLGYVVEGAEAGNFYSAVVERTPGLRAYWRLGDAEGALAREETGRHEGRYQGDVGLGAAGAIVGDSDGAADFREGAVVVPFHENLVSEGTAWSIEAWVQPEVNEAPFALIVGRKTGSLQADYLLEVFRGNRFRYLAQSNFVTARLAEPLAGEEWFHLVAVQDPNGSGEKNLYLNGELVGGSGWRASSVAVAGDAPLHIGGRPDATEWYRGRIDEVAVYERPLSPEEIGEHFRLAREPTGFAPLLATDVGDALRGTNTSLYVRLPFEVDEPESLEQLTLALRYQHGFVAYLNGVEVARRNAPVTPAWDAAALAPRPGEEVLLEERIDVSLGLDALRSGANVLAVHGLNDVVDGSSFLLAARLEAASAREPTFFVEPSPGAQNPSGVVGFLRPVEASMPRGFYDAGFDVTLEAPDDSASLRYTLDGSAPTLENGFDYQGPVAIQTTTVLRAAAFLERHQPSPVLAWTYIFPAHVLQQTGEGFPERWGTARADYAMDPRVTEDPRYRDTLIDDLLAIPVLSVSLAPDDLFGSGGLYSHPESRGRTWERRAAVEFFEAGGGREFHVEAGLRMHGGSSRRADITPQHSLRLHFRREYGARKLEFPLYPDLGVERFDTLVISANSSDNWTSANLATGAVGQFIRDQWARDVQREMGHPYVAGTYVHLFLDGLYWGLYNLTERVDEGLAAEHLGGSKDDYDVVVDGVATHGELTEWQRLFRLARGKSWDEVATLLDVDNFIDYLLINMFTGNWDWPDHNWNAIRPRDPDGRFRFLVWDSEVGLGLDVNIPGPIVPREFHVNLTGRRADLGASNISGGPGELYNLLRVDPGFRSRFSERLELHLLDGGVLSPERSIDLYNRRAEEVRGPLAMEAARWGDVRRDPPDVPDGLWVEEWSWIVDEFLRLRPGIVLEQFRAESLYEGPEAGGRQRPGDLSQDGAIQLDDAVVLLDFLFRGGSLEPICPRPRDAYRVAEVSGDGRVNVVDVVYLLSFVLGSGPGPRAGTECLPMAGCRDVCGEL